MPVTNVAGRVELPEGRGGGAMGGIDLDGIAIGGFEAEIDMGGVLGKLKHLWSVS